MDKRKLHHILVARLRPIRYWYFIVAVVLSALIAAFALRQNNLRAIELRDKVLAVDKADGDIEKALRDLREYTYSHMNTKLSSETGIYPPIQLKYRYERLVAAEKAKVQTAQKDVYKDAQTSCEARFPVGLSGSNRLGCIQQYIDSHGSARTKPKEVPDALYKFDFVSPTWSPDLAGWSLVVCGIACVLLASRAGAELWVRHQLAD